jgi:hypothetical protein
MGSDIKQQISSMQRLMKLPVDTLYLGHFGIVSENVKGLMQQTLHKMHQVLEIGVSCMKQNRLDLIKEKLNELIEPYIERMRRVRGEAVYQYITQLHVPFLLDSYTQYCKNMLVNQSS